MARHIDTNLAEALSDIRETLYHGANFAKEPGLFSYTDFGLPRTLYPGANKATELDEFLYDNIIDRGSRGGYKPQHGRIFLRRGSWCRDTLIHETLHSVSIFAYDQNIRIGDRYPFLREGLTELLNGHVLWRRYPQCFDAWKDKTYRQWCSLEGYEDITRIWYTFCRFVNLGEVERLYFGNGSFDWNRAWSQFIRSINDAGYDFEDPFQGRVGRFQDRFVVQCRRAFGKYEFDRIFEMESSDLDYGSIALS